MEKSGDTAVFTFGRLNPPTTGHGKLIDAMAREQKKNAGAKMHVFVSHSQDAKKNPLDYKRKVAYIKKMFPKYAKNVTTDSSRNIFEVLVSLYNKGYASIIMVVGSDRVDEFEKLINEYNGVKSRHGYYGFDNVEVVSAGERDPDAEGLEGMSASKMRKAAMDGDFDSFSQGVPSDFKDVKRLYADVRSKMGIREEKDMGEMDVYEEMRDDYLTGKLWNVGDIVEANGMSGEIVRKGTNYISFMAEDGKVHKAWLSDITEKRTSGPDVSTRAGRRAWYNERMRRARAAGHPNPKMYASQAALETGWGKSKSAKGNLVGMKARKKQAAERKRTKEFADGKTVKTSARFAKFDKEEGGIKQHGREWKGGLTKSGGRKYATDPDYGKKISSISKMYGKDQDELNTPAEKSPKSDVPKKTKPVVASAPKKKSTQSFGQAFAAARKKEGGPGGIFTWKGKKYNTRRADDPKPAKTMTASYDPEINENARAIRRNNLTNTQGRLNTKQYKPNVVKVKQQKLATAKKLPTVKPMKTSAKKLPTAKKYGSTNTPFKAKPIQAMKITSKRKSKPINASYELDEMAWFMKAKAKIDQMTHPRAYDKMIKDYVNRLKSSSMERPGHIAGKVAREYGVPARNFQQYVNKLVSTGVLPSDLKAQYHDESFSFKDFVNKINEVKQDDDVKDMPGTQPAKYHSGVKSSIKDDRDRHFKAKKAGPAPGDKGAKTIPSVHTKKYKQMFGEVLDKDASIGDYVKDFKKSDAPQFKGKSDKKKHTMAVAAYLSRNEALIDSVDEMLTENGHTDVASMKTKVAIAYKALEKMKEELDKLDDGDDLPTWWTNKVATAVSRIDDMSDYLDTQVDEAYQLDEKIAGLIKKSDKSNISYGILKKVYDRGMAAWKTGHRPGTTPQQWAFARVNSFITKGSGTWGKADKDLASQVREMNEIDERIVWKKPHHKSEHDEVHTQAGTEAGTFPDHVHNFLNHLKKPENYHAAMKGGTTSRLSPRAAGKMGNTDANNPKGTKGLEGAKVRRVSKLGGAQTMPIALKDTHTGHTHLLAGNTRTTAAAAKGNMTHVHTLHYDSSKNHNEAVDEGLMDNMFSLFGKGKKPEGKLLGGSKAASNLIKKAKKAQSDRAAKEKKNEEYESEYESQLNEWGEIEEASEYDGRSVTLNKPMAGDVKKSKVYVKNEKGNVVKVEFGDPNMTIKKHIPARRKSFRARHNCDNPGPKWMARYWSCKAW